MRFILLFLLAVGLSTSALADQPDWRTEVLSDGVIFVADGTQGATTVSLAGPDLLGTRIKFGAGSDPFIDINNVNGLVLQDGLYKYELVSSPRQAADAAGVDRNAFSGLSNRKISPYSGSFRVINGVVVDPYLEEATDK